MLSLFYLRSFRSKNSSILCFRKMQRILYLAFIVLVIASEADAWRRRRRRRSSPPPPPPDTTPPSFSGCPRSLGNQYTTTSTAVVSWSEPTCSDAGSACTVSRTSGAAPGSSFSAGAQTTSYRAADTSGNSATCSITFTVIIIRCSSLGAPSYGSISCTNGNSVGSVCYFACNTGYRLGGSTSRTCQASGTSASWTGSSASCSRITCSPSPSSPSRGSVSCTNGAYHNSVCTYLCNAGYTMTSGNSQISCTSSGWTGSQPQCADVSNPTFTNCPSTQVLYADDFETTAVAQWALPSVTDTSGESITPVRTDGPAPGSTFQEGITPVKYTAADSAGNQAQCTFTITVNVIRCSALSGGSQLLVSCPSGSIRGSECTFACSTGYLLVGSSSTECQKVGSSGSWSNTTPTCQILQCPVVNTPNNGGVVGGSCTRNFGSTCYFVCNPGYVINNDQLRCVAQPGSTTAYWEGEIPYCVTVNCTKPALTPGLQITTSSDCPASGSVPAGSQCQFECTEGYYRQGADILTCQNDGTWSQPTPSCLVVMCDSNNIPVPVHGAKQGCPNAQETYGTVCALTCDTGYLPDIPTHRECLDDGTGTGVWDGGPVVCTIVMCAVLTPPINGFVSGCSCSGVSEDVADPQKYNTICSLQCNTGFTRTAGPSTRSCLATGGWGGSQPTCDDITPPVLNCPAECELVAEAGTTSAIVPWNLWEPVMATDAGLQLQASLENIDAIPISNAPATLVEGTHVLTYSVTDAAGNTERCSFSLTVRVIRCPALSAPSNGNVILQSGQGSCVGGAVYGSRCGFTCDTGYQLSTGGSTVTRNCARVSQSDLTGFWNGTQPSCPIKNCTVPVIPHGHTSDCQSTAVGYGTTCEFECDRGYTTASDSPRLRRTCRADTTWDGLDLICDVVITCPAQLSLDYGTITPAECITDNEVWFDTVCEFSCGSGFLLHGPTRKQCTTSGVWNDQRQPHCEDIENPVFSETCPIDMQVDAERGTTHAHVTLSNLPASDNSGHVNVTRIGQGSSDDVFQEGSTAVPYLATDSSGNEARCDVVVTVNVYRCPDVHAPVDGSLVNCSDPIFGSQCSFQCDIGHDVIGNSTLTCEITVEQQGSTPDWDYPSPLCRIRTCLALQTPPLASTSGCFNDPPATETYGTVCTFACPYGYQGIGESRKECDENGEWTSTDFICERTPCPPLSAQSGITISPQSCLTDPRFGDVCRLQCSRSGFDIDPPEMTSISCSGNSRWTKNIITAACKDVEPPVFMHCPDDFITYADRSLNETAVMWYVNATDNDIFVPSLLCDPPSDSTFPIGNHRVNCLATDRSGNQEQCVFDVTVDVRRCASLLPPSFGTLNGSCSTAYGSECHVTCLIGYKLIGPSSASCEFNGTDMYWNRDKEPYCEVIGCSPIVLPPVVDAFPPFCAQEDKVTAGTVCTFHCPNGLSLVGDHYPITCQINGDWSRHIDNTSMSCKDQAPPTVVNCPDTIHVNRTQYWGVQVSFDLPSATDNIDQQLQVITNPVDLKSPFNFTFDTMCTYTFIDDAGNNATCLFSVYIRDIVTPIFLYCPEDKNITTSQQMALVSWDDPVVQEIPGDEVLLTCNYDNNQVELPWGEHLINYRATNLRNGLSSDCQFFANIEPVPCRDLHVPAHGALACDGWMYGRYCSVSCDENYDIPRQSSYQTPTDLFVCGSSGLWSPHAYVADCSETRDPRRSNLPSMLQYYPGDCGTPAASSHIAQSFILTIEDSVFKDICDLEESCTVDNVLVSCGGVTTQDIRTRRLGLLRRRKRNTVDSIEKGIYVLRSFDKTHEIANVSVIVTMNISIDNSVSQTIRTGLDVEQKLIMMADMIHSRFKTYHQLTSPRSSMTTGYSTIECDDGYVADHENLVCIACSSGTYFDPNTAECISCSRGYYQSEHAQFSCKKCPPGQSTEYKGSRSISQCKDRCPFGHFSSNGLSPCIACPRHTFQPMTGQAVCFECPNATFTTTRGAISLNACHENNQH